MFYFLKRALVLLYLSIVIVSMFEASEAPPHLRMQSYNHFFIPASFAATFFSSFLSHLQCSRVAFSKRVQSYNLFPFLPNIFTTFLCCKTYFFVFDVVYVMYVTYVEAGNGRNFKRLNVA